MSDQEPTPPQVAQPHATVQSADTLAAALASLPHGPEFRFIDRLTELVPGKIANAEYLVKNEAPFLRGHFPNQPMIPGVLLVESVAQLAGIVAQSDRSAPQLNDLRLTAINRAKILGTAIPGQTLAVQAELASRFGNLIQARGRIRVDGKLILSVDLVLSGKPQ